MDDFRNDSLITEKDNIIYCYTENKLLWEWGKYVLWRFELFLPYINERSYRYDWMFPWKTFPFCEKQVLGVNTWKITIFSNKLVDYLRLPLNNNQLGRAVYVNDSLNVINHLSANIQTNIYNCNY